MALTKPLLTRMALAAGTLIAAIAVLQFVQLPDGPSSDVASLFMVFAICLVVVWIAFRDMAVVAAVMSAMFALFVGVLLLSAPGWLDAYPRRVNAIKPWHVAVSVVYVPAVIWASVWAGRTLYRLLLAMFGSVRRNRKDVMDVNGEDPNAAG